MDTNVHLRSLLRKVGNYAGWVQNLDRDVLSRKFIDN
ncbi:hypothetical protein LAUMK42_03048 [Mycobacterium persicum]|uniref:Uncharacterized protein n=1 Tax=Mycobacterium persicum TaxID=1487726 RepID=A0AB38UU28_9MYCO|nr:hypothetical protein LAUMK42_03048 [Mycobacterium persicum]